MPITKVKGPDGEIYNVSHPEGASKSEIIQYAQIYGPTYNLPTITDSVGQIEQEEQEEFDRTFFGQVGESAKGVGRGFGRGLLSGLEGLAELADAATDYVGLEGLIDSGDENEIIRLARSGKDVVNKMLPTDQAYEDAWWTKFGEGLGSFGSFLVPGGAIKAVGLMPKLRALSQGGGKIREYGVLAAPASPLALGVGAQDQAERIQRARDSGVQVDDATADASVLMGGVIGLTELAPIGAVLKGLPKEVAQAPFFQSLLPRLKSALASGSLEGIQEVSARLLQDATERNMYNPNLQVGDSMWDEFTIGGSVGALADLTLNAFAGRKSYALKKEEIARIQSALEKRRKYLEEVSNNPLIAQEIENIRGQSFTAMTTDPATGENILGTVVTDGSGNQIGPQFSTPQEAALFAYNLNNYVIDKSIERNIQSAVNSSGTSYSESQVNDLVNLGMKVFDLTSNTVTENALNFAFDPYLSSETSTLSAKEAIDAGVKPQDMTPAQRINAKRLNRGLPEVKEFTIPEVRSELKNNFDRIFSQQYVNLRGQSFEVQTRKKRPVVVSSFGEVIDSRPLMAEEKTADNYFGRKKFDNIEEATEYANYLNQKAASTNPEESIQSVNHVIDPSQVTVKQLESLLRQKNIDADVNSKEFRALVEHYTGIKASGKTTVDKLNQNDLALLYTKIRELPTLNQFTAIPEFKVYPYTTDHFSAAARTVMETGAMPTQQELINTVGPITKGEYDAIASDIQSNPRFQTSIEALAQETTDLYKSVQDALESSMKGFGLDDVKVNFLDSVRSARVGEAGETVFGARKERADTEVIEGSYKPSLNSVFIALDGIVADPRYRAAKESEKDSVVEQLAVEILGHEVIHPARELDLFTAKEWETLSRKVGEISKGEDANYIEWSVRNYAAPGVTQETIVEEAVAEMMRDALAGKISLTGKPRSLIQRMINFIKGIVSFKNKTGYSRFEDVVEAFRVGEVGARQRGKIRTDVAIGKVEGTPIIQRPGVERQPDFIPDDEMFARAWQGGPNRYRVADVSAIGSGQGAQTFGYGLYYAEERMVADLYRKSLSAKRFKDTWEENLDLDASFFEVVNAIDDGVFSPDQVAFLKALEKYDWLGYDYVPQAFSAIQSDLLSGQQSFDAPEVYEAFENLGYIYEADIKDSAIDNMLDWDVEVGSQPNVANKIARLIDNLNKKTNYLYSFNPRMKGRDAFGVVKELVSKDVDFIRSFDPSWDGWYLPYNQYNNSLKGEINKKASELLKESGIRGIKYFDQGSRPAARATQGIIKPLMDSVRGTPQTQNFVVFNSGDIVTRKRNGKELVAELKKKNPELQGIQDQLGVSDEMFSRRAERAYEQGFDLDEIFYHGRLSSPDNPVQSFALRPSRTPAVDVYVTALPEFADTFAEYPKNSIYDARTGKFESVTSTVYPLVLKRGLKFADLRDKDVIEKLRKTQIFLYEQLENGEVDESQRFPSVTTLMRSGLWAFDTTMRRLDEAEAYPEKVSWNVLGKLAPLIKEAGYDGYFDIEYPGQGITGRAVFDGRNVKGLFARFDPESVPEGAAYEDDMMYAKRLEGMPETFMVDGQAIEFGYFDRALDAARSYERRSGIPYVPLTEYAPVDESRAKKIAIEYEYMEHKPNDPEVRAAYEAMAQETLEQYKDILATGLNVRFIKGEDPYGNPRNAILDIYNNNNFFVFSTRDGFGADAETTIREQKDVNPLLRDSGFKTSDGDPMLVNDVFRVVHDYFGHAKNGVGFRARGEENAWQSHASMYSPLARRAMTTETRGQNSWVNFGPEAEYNRTASPADTIYADQKIGLLPIWVSEEGRLSADSQQRTNRDFTDGLEGAIDPNGRLLLTHYSTEVFERLDPSKAGTGADYIKSRRQWNPKATYYGIVKAVKDGYRKEGKVAPGAGAIEYTASIDPYLIYPADKDPYNLWVPNNYRQSIRNMKDAGYSGYRSNNPSLGKVALLWDSLPIDSSESVYGRKDDEMYARRSSMPMTSAVKLALKKHADVRFRTEEEFFGKIWPALMKEVGGTVSPAKLRIAARRANKDILEFIKENPQYKDYYSEDMKAARAALEEEYGQLTDAEFLLYQFLNGITSLNTLLNNNVGDAVNAFDLYRRDGNFDSIVLGKKKGTGSLVIKSSPISISGRTNNLKARSMKSLDKVIRSQGGLEQAFKYLFEPVTMKDLESFKKSLGYKGVAEKQLIRGLVEEATGQDQMIPRMFFLGPKIGAYTLNMMGDDRYQTVDVWEARFIRSYFDKMFDTNTGITATAEEGKLFRDFGKYFAEEFEKLNGYRPPASALQAMRWFYMINSAKQAGYTGASTDETISQLTQSKIKQTGKSRYEGRTAGAGKVQKRKSDESFSKRTKRSLPKDQVEQAVKKNIEEFNSSDGRAIPAVNVFASPDAQYIADNPDAALEIPKDDVVYSRRRPSFGGSVDNIIEEVGGSPLTGRTPFDSYEEASGAVATPSRLNYLLTKAKQAAVNRYARLEQLNYSTELRENLADTSSISAALQADKAMAIVSAAFKYGIPVYKNGTFMVVDDASAARLGIASPSGRPIKSLMEIMNQLFDTTVEDGDYTALAKTYAAALRTERLMRQGITKHPGKLDQSQINEIKAVVDGLTDPATGKNIVKDWYRDWQDYNTAVITMMQDAGILTDETADLWRNWSDYIPFYRFSEGSAKTLRSDVKGIGEKVFGGMNVISQMKRLKGSEEGLNMDLIDAVTMNLTAAVQMSMKNVAQQRIARDMIQLGLARQLRPNESGISTAEFRVNGKNTKVEIYDPLIYESMMPLSGTEIVQMVRETFGIPATFLREMITRDPGFIIANLFRDSLSTFVTSGTNMTPVVDTFASYFGDMKELEMLGVIGGYDLNALPSEIGSSSRLARLFASNKGPREFFEMETQRAGMGPKGSMSSLNLFKRLWDAAGRATSRSDGATRRAVFNDVYARTGNLAEAAFQAQEIINFGRRGRSPAIRALTAVIPFLNARIQGVDVLWRGLTGRYTTRKDLNRTQVLMSALTRASLMATMTALYWALVRDDEQYEEAPDYLKDNYWIIPTPLGAPITLPVPFEVGFLFKTVPEAILDTSYGDRTNRELRETVTRGLQSTFEISPFSIQAVGPLLEAGLNYNAYTGRRIVPFYVDEKITEGFQSTAYTNQLAKIIGESMNISPLKVEHVMQGYAGTLGQYFLDFIDRSLRSDYAGEGAVLPAMRFYDYPFAKRFFGRVADRGLQEDAYDIYRQVDVVYNTIERLKKEGKVDELFAYLKARETLLGMRGSMNNLKSYLDKVRRYKKTVIESDLSAEEKRKQIEEADMILNAALREVIPYLKNVSDMPLRAFEPLYYEQ